jgi:drug/metabolite transporter (DMT)-like permease
MWFYLLLLSPIISALAVVLTKKLIHHLRAGVLTWATYVFSNLIVGLVLLKEGIPSINWFFIIGILGSDLFFTIYKVFSFKAIRNANLSLVYPLSSLGPIFSLIFAFFPPLSEKPSLISLIGVIITIAGCYLLNVQSLRGGILKPLKAIWENKNSFLMLIAIIIGSISAIFDKVAMKNTYPTNSTYVLFIENLFIGIGLLPILYRQDKNFLKPVVKHYKSLLLLGTLLGSASIFVFKAMSVTNIAFALTIVRTQILFVLLFSWLFFGDKPKKEVIFGSMIMILGVVLIKLGA